MPNVDMWECAMGTQLILIFLSSVTVSYTTSSFTTRPIVIIVGTIIGSVTFAISLIVAYSVYTTILRIKKRKLMTPDERELPQIFSIRNSNQELEMDSIIQLRTDTAPNNVDINILDDDEFFGSHKASSLPDHSSFVPQAPSTTTNDERSTTEELSSPPPASSTLALQYLSRFDRDYHSIERRHSEEEPQATPQSVNPFFPPYSADPYNTAEHIPKWMEPVGTLTDCTSDGRSYYDEHNDFRLEIPEGAIPEGERVTIDIGVALYGPFQYPKGLRTVSLRPVFWACIRGCENFRFLKPVMITIEHCLSLDRDTDPHSLGLTFLKGDHSESTNQKYLLQRLQGDEEFEFIANDNHAVLHTNHFCYQCVASEISMAFIENAGFCIVVLTPKEMVYSKTMLVYFFVIFLLDTCIKTIEKQIDIQEGEGGIRKFYTTTLLFRYLKGKDNPMIKLQWERTLQGGWSIELRNDIEVNC